MALHEDRSLRPAVLSIDVDDYLIAHLDFADQPVPEGYATRIARELETTLGLLEDLGRRATFFVNTQYADRLGDGLAQIVAQGHDLGSHGHHHRNLARLSPAEFRDDLHRSLDCLSRYQAVTGHRAPGFSMPYEDDYFEPLLAGGIRYVSNGVGVSRSTAPYAEEPVELPCGLLHVPISTRVWSGGIKVPVGYASAARLAPERLAVGVVRNEIRRGGFFHFYLHPFEIHGTDPRLARHVEEFRRRWAARILGTRCQNRQGLFRKLLLAGRFRSIESSLAEWTPNGACASALEARSRQAPASGT